MSVYPPAELRKHLVETLGLCRMPSDDSQQNADLAICYVDNLGGCPYPPDAQAGSPAFGTTAVNLTEAGGLATVPGLGKFYEQLLVRIDVRSSSAVESAELMRAITNDLEDQQQKLIGDLKTEYSGIFARAQSIGTPQDTSKGHFRTMTIGMTVYRDQLEA